MKRLLATALAATLLASTPALAVDDGGPYVGAGLGSYGVDIGSFDGEDVGFKVFGGWMFNPYVGGEVEYIDGGRIEERGARLDMSGVNVSLKAVYPLDQFNLYAQAGVYFWDVEVGIRGEGRGDDHGEDFSWGIGFGMDLSENVGLTIEYQGFEVADTDTTDFVSASIVWKF